MPLDPPDYTVRPACACCPNQLHAAPQTACTVHITRPTNTHSPPELTQEQQAAIFTRLRAALASPPPYASAAGTPLNTNSSALSPLGPGQRESGVSRAAKALGSILGVLSTKYGVVKPVNDISQSNDEGQPQGELMQVGGLSLFSDCMFFRLLVFSTACLIDCLFFRLLVFWTACLSTALCLQNMCMASSACSLQRLFTAVKLHNTDAQPPRTPRC